MKKYAIIVPSIILAGIALVIFSVFSTGDDAIEMKTDIQLTSDTQIIENVKSMSAVQEFLSKYPDAQLSINEKNGVVTYRIYLDEKESQNSPYELLSILIGEDNRPIDISLECWDGKEKHSVTGEYNVQLGVQDNFCKMLE